MKPPKHVYNSSILVNVCTGVDRWQQATVESVTVNGVNFQNAHETRLDYNSTVVALNALVFIDSDYSKPALDYWNLQKESEANGKPLTVTYSGDEYEVLTVDRIENPFGKLDHWELSLK